MGALFGGPTTTQQTSNAPWGPQQPFLEQGFNQAQSIEQQRLATGPYTGNLYTGMNPQQLAGANTAGQWANGAGNQNVAGVAGATGFLQGATPNFVANAQNLALNPIASPPSPLLGTIGNYATGAGPPQSTLSGAINQAAITGANNMNTFGSQLSGAVANANTDPTKQINANAATYANNPYIQQAVSAVNQQIGQTLNEQTLPGINREAAMGGALNSSRAGAANAQAQQGAAITAANADAGLYNNAFGQGLNTAANTWATGLGNAISGASLGLNDSTSAALGAGNQQINAANSGLNSILGYNNSAIAQQLAANSQLGQAASSGLLGALDTGAAANSNFQLGQAAGGVPWQNANLGNAANFQQWQNTNQYPQSVLSDYMKDVTGNFGGQGSATSQTNPSALSTALGIGALGNSGLFGSLGASGLGSIGLGSALGGSTAASAALGANALGGAVGAASGGSGILGSLGSLFAFL